MAMRYALVGLLLLGVSASVAVAAEPTTSLLRPYGLEKRIPWTTSRVIGSPDPPLPYRTRRAFPELTIKQPLSFDIEPGTNRAWVIEYLGNWAGPAKIVRFADRNDIQTSDVETLLELDHIAYGLAFHPKFAENGYVFIGCNGPMSAGEKKSKVLRYQVAREPPHKLDPKSQTTIIEWKSDGHNGADLAFGPDGCLYITAGDGTSDSDGWLTGQTLDDLNGSCLRIDVDHPDKDRAYSIPADNPFVKTPGARGEIWAYGLRNPWRITFDAKTGHLWIGNNGQDLWEQVFFVNKGDNFGWSVYEGGHPFQLERKLGPTPVVKPAADHHHSEARSLTGGRVYHGQKLPELRGAYIYGDFSTGRVWGIKHDGKQVTWQRELTDTPLQITGFGIDAQGELLIVDQGGGFYHLEPTPPQTEPSRFPRKLSETGLFLSVKDHQVDPALIPYSVNAPLWSDGAHKERFIALPGKSQIDFGTFRGWAFPEGAVLVKTFALDETVGDPTSRRRIETRLMTKQQNEWVGYTYLWNNEQTEATLVERDGADRTFKIKQNDGSTRELAWHYPSRAECMVCHSRASNFVLGLCEMQMNKEHDYGRVKDNQLRALAHIGVLRVNALEHDTTLKQRYADAQQWIDGWTKSLPKKLANDQPLAKALVKATQLQALRWQPFPTRYLAYVGQRSYAWLKRPLERQTVHTSVLPKLPSEYRRLVDPADVKQPLEARVRSYLHSNCATCHVEAGGGNALMELEFNTPADKLRIMDVRPQHHTYGIAEPRLIAPGHPERSILLQRISRRGAGQMPPLASNLVDDPAVELMREWIKSLGK